MPFSVSARDTPAGSKSSICSFTLKVPEPVESTIPPLHAQGIDALGRENPFRPGKRCGNHPLFDMLWSEGGGGQQMAAQSSLWGSSIN